MRRHINDDMLVRFADNELTGKTLSYVREHIAECGQCREKLHEIVMVKTLAGGVNQIDVSPEFDGSLERRIDEAIAARERRPVSLEIVEIYEMIRSGAREILLPRAPVAVRAFVSAVFLFGALFTGIYLTEPAKPVVSAVDGSAFVLKKGSQKWEGLRPAMVLAKGDKIMAERGSQVDLALAGKYYMRLKENTTIKLAKLSPKRMPGKFRADLEGGALLVDIEKKFKGSRFDVKTNVANVRAVGTRFMVTLGGMTQNTWVGVLEGKVNVASLGALAEYPGALRQVNVEAGNKTEIMPGKPLESPRPLLDAEWKQLAEIYKLGRKTTVALLIGTGKNRVLELLAPCSIFITDEKPREIPKEIDKAVNTMATAIERKDLTLHLEAISLFEGIVKAKPEADYNVLLLLFIGTYYNYTGSYLDAINAFDRVAKEYPSSPLVSLAECAKAYIYEEFLQDTQRALEIYRIIQEKYPESPEARFAKDRIEVLRTRPQAVDPRP